MDIRLTPAGLPISYADEYLPVVVFSENKKKTVSSVIQIEKFQFYYFNSLLRLLSIQPGSVTFDV